MATFIIADEKLLVIDTDNIKFGSSSSSISAKFHLDESVVGTTPTITATPETDAPFLVSVSDSGTTTPTLKFVFSDDIADLKIGTSYQVTITANGVTDTFTVKFLFSQVFDPTAWTNSTQEDSLSGYFVLNQIPEGANLRSTLVNTKFKSLFSFLSLVNFKITDLYNRFRIKKNLSDIINCAVYTGALPAGYTGTITYVSGTMRISSIVLADDNADSDSYTKITFNYSSYSKTITKTSDSTVTTSSFYGISSIYIDRVSDNTGATKQYRLASVTVSRTSLTFTSIVDSNYSITMPMISGWTVTE